MLIISSLTVCSQNFLVKGDSATFHLNEVKTLLKAAKQGEICDSISKNQHLQIINFKEVLSNKNKEIKLHKERISEVSKELKSTQLKLKISKKLSFYGIPIAFGGGVLLLTILK